MKDEHASRETMISKCANPDCTQDFDYRMGRVIRFHNDEHPIGPCVRHFWLCGNCSRTHLLEYQGGTGVVIRTRLGDSAGDTVVRPVCECALSKGNACCVG